MKRNNLLLLHLQLHTGNLLGNLYQHQHEEIGFRKSRLITLETDQLFYLHPFKERTRKTAIIFDVSICSVIKSHVEQCYLEDNKLFLKDAPLIIKVNPACVCQIHCLIVECSLGVASVQHSTALYFNARV